jgi:glycosyltransferase involved in cell wall biosynthesis
MKVLFLTSAYPVPEYPVVGIFVKEHARAAATGAEVAIAHLHRDPNVRGLRVEDDADDEFTTVRVRFPQRPRPLSYVANCLAAILAYRRIRRRGFDPDVIHAHFFLAGLPAVLLGRIFRKPVVLTEQWSVFLADDPSTLSAPMRRFARFTFDHADVVLPVSDALRDGIRAIGTRAELRVIPNVVDTSLFHPADSGSRNGEPKRLIGVGQLYEAKGWEYLLEAVALLSRKRRDFRVDVVGDGALRDELEQLAHRLGIDDLVEFHGWLSKGDVAARVRASNLFVITSRYDSNPCAVIEALASGVPVVGTAVGGIPGLVGDGMGLLAEPRNTESIADRIETALEREWDRASIANAARAQYGTREVGERLGAIYEEVLRRAR